ncbi:MAG: L-Lysine--8-amino-7-oxononanoate transaminase [Phycisphaerae bacterium]|nr:L-Lysine--8-amino-7-oxononanoate transaminase [Phycisphaerae bacterium]
MSRAVQLDRRFVWHPFTPMADWVAGDPVVIAAGEGNYLIDEQGRRYLDGVSSLWCNLHGHRHPTIDAAVRDQLGRIAHSTFLGLTHAPGAELAERLIALAPPGLERVFYSDSGATACEIACKIAFTYWQLRGQTGRAKFLKFVNAYHGDTVGTVSLGGIDLFHAAYRPLLFETLAADSPYFYRSELATHAACGDAVLAQVERVLAQNAGQVAGIFIEPLIQGAAGIVTQPAGFLRRLREIADAHDVLLIADEVAVGFGRTGRMFACEHEGVSPDLMCLAKGISGGYLPLAATLVSGRVFEPFQAKGVTFYHGHTYTANPLGCAAGLASLRVFEEERTLENLPAKIERFTARLRGLLSHPHVGDVRGWGLFAGAELVADQATKEPFPYAKRTGAAVCLAARRHGLMIRPLGDVLVFIPPLSITTDQIDAMFDAVAAALGEVLPA